MVPIHTKPPCKEYDEGWDRIFKRPDRDNSDPNAPQLSDKPAEETTLSPEQEPAKRMPRGWTPKHK